jgi:hypothetical protein
MGATASLVTLASGLLYSAFSASAFWFMAAMCGMAIPMAMSIHRPRHVLT